MKLNKLTAKNYKSLEDIEIKFNGNYCAISGKNNSGKSNIIHLITYLLGPSSLVPWDDNIRLDFKSDCTQWMGPDTIINIHYEFSLNDRDDKGLIEFIKRFANKDIKYNDNKDLLLEVSILLSNSSELEYKVLFEKEEVAPKDIIRRLRDSELLILHNSTKNMMPNFFLSGKTCFGLDYTREEYKDLDKALSNVKKKVEKISKNRILRCIGNVYVEIIRGTPMLLQILILFAVVPLIYMEITGERLVMNVFLIGVIAMGINSGAYVTELIRSGINGVDKGQWEACETLGLTRGQTMKLVILPQAFKRIVPPLVSEFVTLIKDSSLVSTIGVVELLKSAQVLGGNYADLMSPLIIAGVMYLIMTLSIAYLARHLERRLAESD